MKIPKSIMLLIIATGAFVISACVADDDTPLQVEENIGEVAQAIVPADIAEPPLNEIRTQSPHEQLDPTLTRVPPSTTDILPPGVYVETRDEHGDITDRDAFLEHHKWAQRMGERTWLVTSNVFSTMAILGNGGNGLLDEEGWLLVDCGGHNGARPPLDFSNGPPQFQPGGQELANLMELLDQIATEQLGHPVPVIAGVPTHPHVDHNGHFRVLRQMFPNMRFNASKAYRDYVTEANLPLERPDQPQDKVIISRKGGFLFDKKIVHLWTPAPSGHTPADSIVISPDGVAMAVDIFGTEGRLGFVFDSVVENPFGKNYVTRVLLGLMGYECDVTDPVTGGDCEAAGPTGPVYVTHLIPGHFGNGTAKDLISSLRFARAQDQAWYASIFGIDPQNPQAPPNPISPDDLFLPGEKSVDHGVARLFYGQADNMYRFLVADNYQKVHWNVAGWQQMMEKNQSIFLYRFGSNQTSPQYLEQLEPERLPDYSPISPDHTPAWGLLL